MDEFDYMSRRVAEEIVEVCKICDVMEEPFRSGGISAMEELYFRLSSGHYLDWEELKPKLLAQH